MSYMYFMRELPQHDAMVKSQLPVFLTSWVDKSSVQCMYTMGQTRAWSISHLKAGCWYIECGKTICPIEEEVVKAACDRDDSQVRQAGSTHVGITEEENEVDISLLPEKEKNKTLNQRAKAAEKAKAKADREAEKAKKVEEKAKKVPERKGGRAKKTRAQSSALHLTETSIASPSQSARKRDFSTALLSTSRL